MSDHHTPDGAELLDALRAVHEALDLPFAASVGDDAVRAGILDRHLGHAVAMLAGILGRDTYPDIPWAVAYLRERLAEHPPAGYKTWNERMTELKAAKAAGKDG